MNKGFAFDIETIPNHEMIPYLEEPKAPKSIKDPVKIKQAIQEKRSEQVDKMALSPFTGRVACYAIIGPDGFESSNILEDVSDKSEALLVDTMLAELRSIISKKDIIVTWNGLGFDIPFIFARAIALNLEPLIGIPTLSEMSKKYTFSHHCDLMPLLGGREYMKLNTAATSILGPTEKKIEFDVTEILPRIITGGQRKQDVLDYCIQDVRLTYKLWERAHNFLFRMNTQEVA